MFIYNEKFQFVHNGQQYEVDPMALAPVEEGHQDYGVHLYKFWGISVEDAMSISRENQLIQIRKYRNKLLAETDWMANSDVVMSDEWKEYRQALRDITNSYDGLDSLVWPKKPE